MQAFEAERILEEAINHRLDYLSSEVVIRAEIQQLLSKYDIPKLSYSNCWGYEVDLRNAYKIIRGWD